MPHNYEPQLERFSTEIEALSGNRETELLRQAEERKRALIRQAEERLKREVDYTFEERLSDIRDTAFSERSSKVNSLRAQLFRERQQYADQVFAEAEARIKSFAHSEDYEEFLTSLAVHLAMQHDCQEAEVLLRDRDMHLAQSLAIIFAADCRFTASEEIHIGGLMLWLPKLNILIDERLETRLEQQRSWFYGHSGLSTAW